MAMFRALSLCTLSRRSVLCSSAARMLSSSAVGEEGKKAAGEEGKKVAGEEGKKAAGEEGKKAEYRLLGRLDSIGSRVDSISENVARIVDRISVDRGIAVGGIDDAPPDVEGPGSGSGGGSKVDAPPDVEGPGSGSGGGSKAVGGVGGIQVTGDGASEGSGTKGGAGYVHWKKLIDKILELHYIKKFLGLMEDSLLAKTVNVVFDFFVKFFDDHLKVFYWGIIGYIGAQLGGIIGYIGAQLSNLPGLVLLAFYFLLRMKREAKRKDEGKVEAEEDEAGKGGGEQDNE